MRCTGPSSSESGRRGTVRLLSAMGSINGKFAIIDLEHQGRPNSVAAYVVESRDGLLVIDPGPTSTLPKLGEGLAHLGYSLGDVAALLLTHIHLDHAGASGTLARDNPALTVHVHEKGAPHLIDPTKLRDSATRLYGDRMDMLWGELAPVPANQVVALTGGEQLTFGDQRFAVGYTPGHASHHVSYLEKASGTAFVGDTAGLYTPAFPVVLPVTPPPDFDLEAWLASIDRILAWHPRAIALTHFGTRPNPETHFQDLRAGLRAWAGYARAALNRSDLPEEQFAAFVGSLRSWIAGRAPGEQVDRFLETAGTQSCWRGLARYWAKRA